MKTKKNNPSNISYCGGLTLAGHQVPKAALSTPLLNCTGERKYNERLKS